MGFRHVVMFTFKGDVQDAQRHEAVDAIASLGERVETVREVSVGLDAGLSEGNYDFVVVMDFDDADGYRAYAAHDAHLEVVEGLKPLLAGRSAAQYVT